MEVVSGIQEHITNIRGLLPEKYPNIAMVEGILEGKVFGKIWHDSESDAYLLTTNSSFNFVIGNVNKKFIEKSLSRIQKVDAYIVSCNDSQYFIEHAFPTKSRLHFTCDPKDIIELPEKIANRISTHYQLCEIATFLFEKCSWKDQILGFYSNYATFLQYAHGMVLIKEDIIASEVFGIIGGSFFEVGAFTNPKYRSLGLVPFIISTLIKSFCISKKLIFTASCDIHNHASEKTIRALGLKQDFAYAVLDVSKM